MCGNVCVCVFFGVCLVLGTNLCPNILSFTGIGPNSLKLSACMCVCLAKWTEIERESDYIKLCLKLRESELERE